MMAENALNTADLLERCREWVRRYVVLTEHQAIVLAAWVLHTWAIDAADYTPYIHITAPEKQCGKSILLRVLQAIVCRPCKSGGMSAAALVRTIDVDRPTLLMDEIDAIVKGDKELAQAFRGILNNGYERGGNYRKVQGKDFTLRTFNVFGPKAFAGIGQVWNTVADRAILVELRRKSPLERVESSRERDLKQAALPLRESLEQWSIRAVEILRDARPYMPQQWTDRQQDISEPLVAIADFAGGEWPGKLRGALTSIFGSAAAEGESIRVVLLRDIQTVFDEREVDTIFSSDLAQALCAMEGQPWADWMQRGMNPDRLARLLKTHGIAPRGTVRIGAETRKGYTRECFADAWTRYCPSLGSSTPVTGVTPVTTGVNTDDSQYCDPPQGHHTRIHPSHGNPRHSSTVTDVPGVTAAGEKPTLEQPSVPLRWEDIRQSR